MCLSKFCKFVTFNPDLARSESINITMHCISSLHMQFYDSFVLLHSYDIDQNAAITLHTFIL